MKQSRFFNSSTLPNLQKCAYFSIEFIIYKESFSPNNFTKKIQYTLKLFNEYLKYCTVLMFEYRQRLTFNLCLERGYNLETNGNSITLDITFFQRNEFNLS